jgi:hypothetical protein
VTILVPDRCPNCGEYWPHFTWAHSLQGKSGIVDGRHCMNEISVDVTLGCDYCSETLVVMPIEEFLAEVGENVVTLQLMATMKNTPPDTGVSQPEADHG